MVQKDVAKRPRTNQKRKNRQTVTGHIVYIGIGSNLEDPLTRVKQAIKQLMTLKQSKLISCSSLYASKPMGPDDQPDYINAVVSIKTQLSAIDLLDELQQLKQDMAGSEPDNAGVHAHWIWIYCCMVKK